MKQSDIKLTLILLAYHGITLGLGLLAFLLVLHLTASSWLGLAALAAVVLGMPRADRYV